MKKRTFQQNLWITMIICLLSFLPSIALASKKAPVVSDKDVNAMLEKVIMSFNNPEETKAQVTEDANKYINVRPIVLNDNTKTYLIEGIRAPFYGAHNPMLWIYEKTSADFRLLADLGAGQDVKPLKKKQNDYRNIEITSISGSVVSSDVYTYDGTRYSIVTKPYSDIDTPTQSSVISSDFKGFSATVLYTLSRKKAATTAGEKLHRHGAQVVYREVEYDKSMKNHVGKLYYYFQNEKQQVTELATLISDIEKLIPVFDGDDPTIGAQKKEVTLWFAAPTAKSRKKK